MQAFQEHVWTGDSGVCVCVCVCVYVQAGGSRQMFWAQILSIKPEKSSLAGICVRARVAWHAIGKMISTDEPLGTIMNIFSLYI